MKVQADYQVACETAGELPQQADIELWVETALALAGYDNTEAELTVRIVDPAEGRSLNHEFRSKDYATNVLSFPFEAPIEMPIPLLGDLVICAQVVEREADEQQKPLMHHWTHMVIHGTLHLLGYDHIEDAEAEHMERIEKDALARLDIPDPYQINH
ncbi:rRNA maturation RNase YbeY [Idiomarina baltica]|uniref:rRNA maturation RNase YbeY n=1 Tax=Idiomarina baltica TaxID=190892 RepID=UPI000C5FC3A1|nr:rRNA maturation RNase YbeY [Idiomarina baltica]MBL74456.1 rRNA maturation RNase YbeY [Idiomarinaceae bacterium]